MYFISFILGFLLCLTNHQLKAADIFLKEESSPASQKIPVSIRIRSIRDLMVKNGEAIKIGQILAPRPVSTVYISKKPEREVEKQKAKLKKVRQVVEAENLSPIFVEHEEAKLRDLEFAAKEHKLLSNQPKAFKETVYKSPVNGIVRRITPLSSSNGLLTVELLVELQ